MWSRKLALIMVITFSLMSFGAAYAADEQPILPAFYSGEVKAVNGSAVTIGTVKAFIDGQAKGSQEIINGKFELLVVEGDSSAIGKTVTFKVDVGGKEYPAVSSPTEVKWNSGDISGVVQGVPIITLTVDVSTSDQQQPDQQQPDQQQPDQQQPDQQQPDQQQPDQQQPDQQQPDQQQPDQQQPDQQQPDQQQPDQQQPAVNLIDIEDSWAKDTIITLVGKGIVGGYPDNTFRPNNQITRAECVTILVKALNISIEEGAALDGFSDASSVPEWAKPYMAAAVKAGLVKGSSQPDGKISLSPQEPITRVELAVIASRVLAPEPGFDTAPELGFADKDQIPAWGQEGVKLAVAGGIIKGYPDNTFAAAKQITRAECAVIALNLLEK